jgi:UDP:flavonoid glycosyltransferase YjiC (YdhE family)
MLDPAQPESTGITYNRPQRDRPTVYVTLGTIFHQESGDLLPRVLASLGGLPVDVVVTVGARNRPRRTRPATGEYSDPPLPSPGHTVLPFCDLTVCHAGSGTVIGALACGVPCLLLPMGADQAHNADRCVRLGAGITLDIAANTATIGAAATQILNNDHYRRAAQTLRAEALTLPDSNQAATLLERLPQRG